ncbi:MAG TPA: ABC transporter permease [Blastocatellia bacterium]|nr:ABC transporter permease [Blastocatellia bacterium]
MIGDLWQDLRYSLRMLRKHPGLTVVAALSLALGIGGNAAMFSLINGAFIRPLPYAEPDRLAQITEPYPKAGVVAMQERSRTMEVAVYQADQGGNFTGEGEAVHLLGSAVSANLFSLLGAPAEVGRAFAPGEDRPGRDRLVLLSHALWQSKFAGDRGVVGRSIVIDGAAREVVGVMPPEFNFPSIRTQFWIPVCFDPANKDEYWAYCFTIARLRPGATLSQAQSELPMLISQIKALAPWRMADNWNANSRVVPLQEALAGGLRDKLLLLPDPPHSAARGKGVYRSRWREVRQGRAGQRVYGQEVLARRKSPRQIHQRRLGARAKNSGGRCGRCPPIRFGRQDAELYQWRLLYALPAVNRTGSEIAHGHDSDLAHGCERAATRRRSAEPCGEREPQRADQRNPRVCVRFRDGFFPKLQSFIAWPAR